MRVLLMTSLLTSLLVLGLSESSKDENKTRSMAFIPISHSPDGPISNGIKTYFFDYLPFQLKERKAEQLEIRTILPGRIQVAENAQFSIAVSVFSGNAYQLTEVDIQYSAIDDAIILQTIETPQLVAVDMQWLINLSMFFGALLGLILICTICALCFWLAKFGPADSTKQENKAPTPSLTASDSLTMSESFSTDSMIEQLDDLQWLQEIENELNQDDLEPDELSEEHMTGQENEGSDKRPPITRQYSSVEAQSKSGYKRRYRPAAQRIFNPSSSDDQSSVDESWSRHRPAWRKAQAKQSRGMEGTEMSGGSVSSGKASKRLRKTTRVPSRINSSLDELEWDEYEATDSRNPSAYSWKLSGAEEELQELICDSMKPFDTRLSEAGNSDLEGRLSDVREAISSAMDSVNSEVSGASGKRYKSDYLNDDGYETGLALKIKSSLPTDSKFPSTTSPNSNQKISRSANGSKASSVSHLSMTVIMSITVICLGVEVCSGINSQLNANIVIHIPRGYFKRISVFSNVTDKTMLDISGKPEDTTVQLFDVADPVITAASSAACDYRKKCEHGCNRKTGSCVCSRGYVSYEETKCADKNDCLYLPCQYSEVCVNTVGGYYCSCPTDFIRLDNGSCVECLRMACPAGTYEAAPCPKKLCLPCSTSCPDEHYVTTQCGPKADVSCSPCKQPCGEDEYEFRPCTNSTNRRCEPISLLAAAAGSQNVILESRSKRLTAESLERLLDQPNEGREFQTQLNRGSLITIKVLVRSVNLFPTVRPVVHNDSNDNEEFINNDGPAYVLTQFCPYPLPVKYELIPVLHNDVTAAKRLDCPDCKVDPRQPCQTYKVFGRQAPLHPFEKSMVCTEPDSLAAMFDLTDYLTESRSIVVQPSQECEAFQESCDTCSMKCANDTINERGGNCSITAEDNPSSWSPRLMHCQNCCLKRKCKDLCSQVKKCKPISCWKGNVAEFILSAVFPRRTMEFYCHVELDKSLQLLVMDYVVLYNNTELKNFSVTIMQNNVSAKGGSFSDGLLTVKYSTGLTSIPDLIHGTFNIDGLVPDFSSGHYSAGEKEATHSSVSRLDILPKVPFGFSTKWWSDCLVSKHNEESTCSQSIIKRFVINNGSIFQSQPEVTVSKQAIYTYALWNRTSQPHIKFILPSNSSVLEKIYPSTEVDLSTLSAKVLRSLNGWQIVLAGNVYSCPGFFKLIIWEFGKQNPLSEHDAAVYPVKNTCHSHFTITVDVAGSDVQKVQKRFTVGFFYGDGRRQFIQVESGFPLPDKIPTISKATATQIVEEAGRTPFSVMGPYLLVLAVAVSLLSLAWAISVALPKNTGPVVSRPGTRAAFVIVYAVHRVIYTLLSSFTVFTIIWLALNGREVAVLRTYTDLTNTVVAQQNYDLRMLSNYADQKIRAQNELARAIREKCVSSLFQLERQSVKMMQELSRHMYEGLSSLPERNDLVSLLDIKAKELTQRLEYLRNEYNAFAKITSAKLLKQISQTLEDFEKTSWLGAAQLLHQTVISRSPAKGSTKDAFHKWLGIRTELKSIKINFFMEPLPTLSTDSMTLPNSLPVTGYEAVNLNNILLPTHDLYQHVKDYEPARAAVRAPESTGPAQRVSYTTLLYALVFIDIMIMAVRVASSVDTAQSILDGCVIQKRFKEVFNDGCPSVKLISKKMRKKSSRVKHRIYKLILKTDCLPLSIALTLVLGLTYIALKVGYDLISVESLSSYGLVGVLVGPWNLTSTLALESLQMNAYMINSVDIPSLQHVINSYVERLELLNNAFNNLSLYRWQVECGDNPSIRCNGFDYNSLIRPIDVKQIKCDLSPLDDVRHSDIPAILNDNHVQKLLQPYVDSLLHIMDNTATLLLVYACYFTTTKLLAVCLWNILTRLSFIPGVRVQYLNTVENDKHEQVATHISGDNIEEMSLGSLPPLEDLSTLPSLNLSAQDLADLERVSVSRESGS